MTRTDCLGRLAAQALEQALEPPLGLVAKPPLRRGSDVDRQARRAQRPTDCSRKDNTVTFARVTNQVRTRLLRERFGEREVSAAVERIGVEIQRAGARCVGVL